MKTRVLTVAAAVLATVVLTAGPLGAVVSTGPYYAMPAWDQKLDCTSRTSCPRFIVLSNWGGEAVLDRETGLVWEQSPSMSSKNWFDAQFSCNSKRVGLRRGWRLPTIQELMSLIEDLSLPAGHPFSDLQSSVYWSATTTSLDPSSAWVATLVGFSINSGLPKSSFLGLAWCVRGGHGVDPQ